MERKDIKIETIQIGVNLFQYKGICTATKEPLFIKTVKSDSLGIVEFLGAVHALGLIKKSGWNKDVYIKNEFIKECIEEKNYKYKTNYEETNDLLRRCSMWLIDQKKTIIIYTYE